MRDRIVDDIIDKYYERSQKGIAKYGTTLYNNNTDNFFNHALEEAMDFSLYIMKIIDIVNDTPNDADLGKRIREMVR